MEIPQVGGRKQTTDGREGTCSSPITCSDHSYLSVQLSQMRVRAYAAALDDSGTAISTYDTIANSTA